MRMKAPEEALKPIGEDNPLHDAFYVEVNDGDALKDTAEKIQAIEGIESVNYGGQCADVCSSAEFRAVCGRFWWRA